MLGKIDSFSKKQLLHLGKLFITYIYIYIYMIHILYSHFTMLFVGFLCHPSLETISIKMCFLSKKDP